jgi:hypothetical protein
MYASSNACRPLLRGVLIELFPWRDNPTAPGYQRRMAQIAVWCPWCCRFHFHGWDPAHDGRHAEHRCAHCGDRESPLRQTGYYISVLRQRDPGYSSHVTIPGRAFERPVPEWELQRRARREAERAVAAVRIAQDGLRPFNGTVEPPSAVHGGGEALIELGSEALDA